MDLRTFAELARLNLIWILLGLLVGVLLAPMFRGKKKQERSPLLSNDGLDLARLKNQLRDLESRYHVQMEFFVNFPEVVKSLTAALTQDQVTSACSRSITALLRTRNIAIFLAESQTHLRLVDGACFAPELRHALSIPLGESGLIDIMTNYGVSSLKEHAQAKAFLRRYELPDELAAPIYYGEHQMGLILVSRVEGEPKIVTRTLSMIADLVGVGLHSARKVSQIRDEAEKDALTGLANRRTLFVKVQRELQRCRSYHSRLSLAMIDVDYFKHYNDHNGHAAGDDVLKSVAQIAQSNTRRTDLVARYGGEEFTVVMAGANRDQALQHAERIRQSIASHVFPNGEKQPQGQLTISVGIATFPDDAGTIETLFEAADQALYGAKHAGRNQVVVYKAKADGSVSLKDADA